MRNFQKICAPAFAKAGARYICGYEIWESSKHIRCPDTPENERFSPAPELLILLLGKPHTPFMPELKIPPELFRKALAFIRFDDYNYTVIL